MPDNDAPRREHVRCDAAARWRRGRAGAVRLLAPLLVGILVSVGVLLLRAMGLLEPAELALHDSWLRARATTGSAPMPVVVVAFDENDIRSLGGSPVPDATLAAVLARIAAHDPRAIGLDIYRDLPVPPGTDTFESVLRSHPEIVGVMRFAAGSETGVPPPPGLAGTERVGFSDVLPDPGGIVRRALLFLDDGDRAEVSFAMRIALHSLAAEGLTISPAPEDPGLARLGAATLAPVESGDGPYVAVDAAGYQLLLDYRRPPSAVEVHTVRDLLEGRIADRALRDRAVLVGSIAESTPDLYFSPFSHASEEDRMLPGVVLHALMVDQLVRLARGDARAWRLLSPHLESAWVVGLGVLGALIAAYASSARRLAAAAVLGLLAILGVTYAAFAADVWLPVIPAGLAWLAAPAVLTVHLLAHERHDRRTLMTLFARHVSPTLADAVWRERETFLVGGRPGSRRLVATVMFTDVRRFTTLAERLDPGDLMEWTNEFLQTITPCIVQRDGVILRFLGDGLMAAFGVPVPRETEAEMDGDARAAVEAALAMSAAIVALNRRHAERGMPTIGMRIGICTGRVVGGTVGDAERVEYCLQGDVVNTASRLESSDKEDFEPDPFVAPCRIRIAASTRQRLGNRFPLREVGTLRLRGKSQGVTVFEVESHATSPRTDAAGARP
jgi:adenylate cyclase